MSAAGLRSVCVFCGSASGDRPAWSVAARELGTQLVAHHVELVYGGSRQGLMGTLADTVLQAGGRVMGIMPTGLVEREAAHRHLTELQVVATMAERKARMIECGDAFVALPGGYGTLDELGEVLTGRQLDLHRKPVALLNVDGYYDALVAFLDHATQTGFIRPESRRRLIVATSVSGLFDALTTQPEPA
ncbi:MAG TPA: TIGR00730 family Rossman fold protein [Nevskiaceae bacterium]|nr:TIGR00730 family Rossman fold protein [Nevskiaceae bacterium]